MRCMDRRKLSNSPHKPLEMTSTMLYRNGLDNNHPIAPGETMSLSYSREKDFSCSLHKSANASFSWRASRRITTTMVCERSRR